MLTHILNIFRPEVVGEAMTKLLENGANGSVWVIYGGKFYEHKSQNLLDME